MKKIRMLPKFFLDSHCHGRDMRQKHKTTVFQVLKEALQSGIGITVFMPNTDPAIISIIILIWYIFIIMRAEKKLNLGRQYLYFGATDNNFFSTWLALKFKRVVGIKIYPKGKDGKVVTTGTCGISEDSSLRKHMKLVWKAKKVLAVHCNDPNSKNKNSISAEASYAKKILEMAKKFPRIKIIICHVSCKETIDEVILARESGVNVAVEIMPHYLWFDNDGTNWVLKNSLFYKCFNNLRGKEERSFLILLLLLKLDWIWIASDSACHTKKEKLSGAGGIPSNQEMVAVIMTLAEKLNLSDNHIANLLIYNAAKFLNIPVSKELVKYKMEKMVDNAIYNKGFIVNPWKGTEFIFPEKI